MIRLRPNVAAELEAKGVVPAEGDTPQSLKERLNDLYLVQVRQLRDRQRAGEIPLRDYAAHAEALKQQFSLLGLPLHLWEPPSPDPSA